MQNHTWPGTYDDGGLGSVDPNVSSLRSSHSLSARSSTYGTQPAWPSLYAMRRSGKRAKAPQKIQSTNEPMALAKVMVEPTIGGESGDVAGILDDEPMCMLIT